LGNDTCTLLDDNIVFHLNLELLTGFGQGRVIVINCEMSSKYGHGEGDMSHEHEKPESTAKDISRRGLLGSAALAVGAAASVVTARVALARSADISLDSSGRVLVNGATVPDAAGEDGMRMAATPKKGINTSCGNNSCKQKPVSAKPATATQPSSGTSGAGTHN
jgi:hypothetical protein